MSLEGADVRRCGRAAPRGRRRPRSAGPVAPAPDGPARAVRAGRRRRRRPPQAARPAPRRSRGCRRSPRGRLRRGRASGGRARGARLRRLRSEPRPGDDRSGAGRSSPSMRIRMWNVGWPISDTSYRPPTPTSNVVPCRTARRPETERRRLGLATHGPQAEPGSFQCTGKESVPSAARPSSRPLCGATSDAPGASVRPPSASWRSSGSVPSARAGRSRRARPEAVGRRALRGPEGSRRERRPAEPRLDDPVDAPRGRPARSSPCR